MCHVSRPIGGNPTDNIGLLEKNMKTTIIV